MNLILFAVALGVFQNVALALIFWHHNRQVRKIIQELA